MKRRTFDARADLITRLRRPGRALDVGCGSGAFLCSMLSRGWHVEGVEQSEQAATHAARVSGVHVAAATLEHFDGPPGAFDVVHLADVLEHFGDPHCALRIVHQLLCDDGLLVLTTPDVGSLSARVLGRYWPNYRPEHLFYPDRQTIRRLLGSEGFVVCAISPATKALTLEFARHYFAVYGPKLAAWLLAQAGPHLPTSVSRAALMLSAGDMLVIAKPARPGDGTGLSDDSPRHN